MRVDRYRHPLIVRSDFVPVFESGRWQFEMIFFGKSPVLASTVAAIDKMT